VLLGERGRVAGREAVVLKKRRNARRNVAFFVSLQGKRKWKRLYEENIVCVSREYLPESDGGVRDEGFGG
jgi:hypothetical protein